MPHAVPDFPQTRLEGGKDLRNSDDSWLRRLALPLSAPSVHAIGRERDWYVAAAARFIEDCDLQIGENREAAFDEMARSGRLLDV